MSEKTISFEEWLNEHFPEGIGTGFGGSYSQDDMEEAFNATP
jgi:hypothetical protein